MYFNDIRSMQRNKFYILPDLKFKYGDLSPFLSENQLRIHHDLHHKTYVDNANIDLEIFDQLRGSTKNIDMKALLKDFSFNIGGHVLHTLYWQNLTPKSDISEIDNKLKLAIESQYGDMDTFKKRFLEAGNNCEGSGWAVLAHCKLTDRLLIMQIEKHNVNIYPGFGLLLVLDVWEHAYYHDYQNRRKDYAEAFWNYIDWEEVSSRWKGLNG